MLSQSARTKDLVCGVDTGGTFTDCVILKEDGTIVPAKATSTPGNFAIGVFDSIDRAAKVLNLSLGEVLSRTSRFVVGTTVGTNAFLERKGARVGIVTTRGFEDTLYIMKGTGRSKGIAPRDIMRLEIAHKPAPIVPKRMIRGILERVDSDGEMLIPVDPHAVASAADELMRAGAESIAILFLWAFRNPENERQAKQAIAARYPGIYLSCSHEIAPKIGEYERFTATVINAYIGPVTMRYVDSIAQQCRRQGLEAPPLIMECTGGVMSSALVGRQAVVTLYSGPAGGVTASATLAGALGMPNVITADVGGTSFDVGIIREGAILQTDKVEIGQYEFFSPAIDIRTIGAGGGSLARLDRERRVISVGPESAGANPGPICYNRGGTEPTLTDAALEVGYVSAVTSLGGEAGSSALDRDRSRAAIAALGTELRMDATATAAGIIRIAESNMADLVQRAVVAAGVDPRDFVLFAFGGAGPIHAAGFARELGVKSIVVPYGDVASVWSAYGVATGDIMHVFEYAHVFGEPFDTKVVSGVFRNLSERAQDAFERERVEAIPIEYRYEIGVRYKTQLNEVYVDVDHATELDETLLAATVARFEERYAAVFGAEAGFREAGVELVDFRVSARLRSHKKPAPEVNCVPVHRDAQRGTRPVHFVGLGSEGHLDTAVYDGEEFPTNLPLVGPALIELSGTTVVVPPDYAVHRDRIGNYILERRATGWPIGRTSALASS
jgi:N-methylhydantoinase A